MAKSPEALTEVVEAPPITISLNEFCLRLSETVTAPELIGGFAFSERFAGNLVGTLEQFQARYTAFINKPA